MRGLAWGFRESPLCHEKNPGHARATVFLSIHFVCVAKQNTLTATLCSFLRYKHHQTKTYPPLPYSDPCHSHMMGPHTSNSTTNLLCCCYLSFFLSFFIPSVCVVLAWLFNSLFSDLLNSGSTLNPCTMQPPSICFQLRITGSH